MNLLRSTLVALGAASVLVSGTLVIACNSSGTLVPADASADVAEEIVFFDGPSIFETSTPGDGGTDAPHPSDAGDAGAYGFVQFAEVPVGGGEFTAAFYGSPLPPPPGCTFEVSDGGPCLVTMCPGHVATDAGAVSLVSAGALTVTGGAFGDAGIEISPGNLGAYLYNTTGPMFSPGDTLTVSAAGASVPAFATQSLVAPGAITLTSPVADSGTLSIDTSQSLDLAWTGGATGARFILELGASFTSGDAASAVCSWDATLGTGTVPAGALAPLAAGDAQAGRSTALWYQEAQTTVAAGRWTVGVRAYVSGGSLASFQ